jgi:hypothetical protein
MLFSNLSTARALNVRVVQAVVQAVVHERSLHAWSLKSALALVHSEKTLPPQIPFMTADL